MWRGFKTEYLWHLGEIMNNNYENQLEFHKLLNYDHLGHAEQKGHV